MQKRLEVFLIITVFIVITAIILIIYSKQREQEFKAHNTSTQETLVNGASHAINIKLLEKHRHVQLFVYEYARHLNQIYNAPNQEKAVNDIKVRLQQRFPDFFTYTITNKKGAPKLQNIESLVGHACQLELSKFAKHMTRKNANKRRNKIVLHPQPFNYHFDIMAPLYSDQKEPNIFFVSFYLNEIINILKTHELSKQNLILVRQSDPSLIEVTSQGARDKIKREINLSQEEQKRINVYKNIPGTDWRLVYLADKEKEENYIKGLWTEAITIIAIVTLSLLLMFSLLTRRQSAARVSAKR